MQKMIGRSAMKMPEIMQGKKRVQYWTRRTTTQTLWVRMEEESGAEYQRARL